MKIRRRLSSVFCAAMVALLASVAPAKAAPVTFATLNSLAGVPQILINASTGAVGSADVSTPYDPSDPFFTSTPGLYNLVLPSALGPLPDVLKMAPVSPATVVDPQTTVYGPGSFSIGLDQGLFALPWVTAAFSQMTLTLAPDFSTGVMFDFGHTLFSGLGFDVTGLGAPGSFAFALGNPTFYRDQAGSLLGIGYEVTQGALAAEPVPEPASLLLLGTGLVGAAARVRKRARRNA